MTVDAEQQGYSATQSTVPATGTQGQVLNSRTPSKRINGLANLVRLHDGQLI